MRSRQLLRVPGWAALVIFSIAPRADCAFTAPYDPDFGVQETPQPERPEPEPAPEQEPSPSALDSDAPMILAPVEGRFLLLERPDAGKILERESVAASTQAPKGRDFVEFQKDLARPISYSRERWLSMRSHIEQGFIPTETFVPYVKTEPVAISSEAPKPPPPEVELPAYGTSLSVTGRKVIGFQFSEKRFLQDQAKTGRPASTNLLEINQQLQLRMQGKVGPKITVNVDYDDTKPNKQDISVVYTGDPNEVIQNVSFGDIDLSLPPTEFVSYNKQLFGIRADVKYKGFKGSFIGSRTKGTTKSKQFFGNTQFVTVDLKDIDHVRRQHYDITFGNSARLPIQSGTERVFLSRQIPGQINVNDVSLTVNDLAVQGSSFTGTFSQMIPGQDYTIDYAKGIISFRNQLQPQFVVAVDFVDASGNSITVQTSTTSTAACVPGPACVNALRLIKTPSDLPIAVSSEAAHARELKTFYSIGQTQIVRDNGRGNFILRVLDLQRNEVGPSLNPLQKYPETIFVDFENGTFQLERPFAVAGDSSTVDPEVYAPTPIQKRIIHVEYSFRFKTFFLEPNLVPQSEIVTLDGVKLNRNVDYFIDYEAGFLTFFNEDRIRSQSEINIAFEVAPFAGLSEESLLGTRVSYDFNEHFGLGTTLLYQTGAKAQNVPSVTELSRSLLVYDMDAKLTNIPLFGGFKITSMATELAQSRQKLNLNAYALIDNMEGIRQEEIASTLHQSWFIASNPDNVPADPAQLSLNTEDVRVLDINPRAPASSQETQKVLQFNYNYTGGVPTDEASIIYPFSISGVDFSQKTLLEVVMLGDNSNNEINFHLGGVNEDADADGSLDNEDANRDGLLQPAEDIGWTYDPAGRGSQPQGSGNGRIDSEDLNLNGRLDAQDFTGGDFGYIPDANNPNNNQLFNATNRTTHTVIDFGSGASGNNAGWKTFQIPLNISTATASRWTAIKQIRISVRQRGGGATSGTLKFARIAVVGNTWQRGQNFDPSNNAPPPAGTNPTLTVTPVNNVDNPDYIPIFNAGGEATQAFNDLYGSVSNLQKQSNTKNLQEQALQFDFSGLSSGAVVTTKRLFSRAIDISQHRYFNFLVFGNAQVPVGSDPCLAPANCSDHVFFLRVGNDTAFFEVQVPLNFVGWRKIQVRQGDRNDDSIADTWEIGTPGTVVVSSGNPSLQQVASVVAGIRQTGTGSNTQGRVYLNELHLSEPVTRVGNARKLDVNFEMAGWATFGAKYREVDRNFQTPTSVVSNQDNRQDSAYLNFTRISFLPMTFNLARTITETPSTVQTGDLSNLVNLLQQGKVTTWTGSAQGNFSLGAYPRLGLSHTRNRTEYDLLTRLDDRKTYSGTLQYGVPLDFRLIPKTVDLTYSHTRFDVSFESLQARKFPGNFNTNEYTNSVGARLSFVPWSGSSLNPNYSLTRVTEKRSDFTGPEEKRLSYPKSQSQTAGFTSNYRLLSWLNPQLNYSIDTLENNILNVSTFVVQSSTYVFGVGDIKTINRSGNGSVSLPITIGEIFRATKLFRSLTIISGYQLQDGDVWNNVERGLNTMTSLWIRAPLRPSNPVATRASQTLRDTINSTQRWSPLENYDLPGRWSALRTVSLSNNFVKTFQRTEQTGTLSRTISTTFPDAVANISQLERLWRAERWMSSTQMNFKYASHKTETVGQTLSRDHSFGTDLRTIIIRRFDTLLSYNNRASTNRDLRVEANTQKTAHEDATAQVTFDMGNFRFTPKTDYSHDTTTLGTGVKTQDLTVITPSVLVRADLALPRGLMLPGSARPILFSNRIIWTTTLSLANRRSPVTIADNSRLFSLNTSGDYEIAKNLRMTLNGAMSRLWHKFLKEEDFVSYQFGTTLTFQF
ncbi:MAG: hypothetical protein HY549_05285 [Elusimicrobia bacterium]|nr:hypothetical protein [Elusimicrobiota bacterium]